VQCDCGRDVAIPQLSQLRKAVGRAAFEAGIVDTIRRMIADGELPPRNVCLVTGRFTKDTADVVVQCERVWKRGPGKATWAFAIFAAIFLPFWVLWIMLDHYSGKEKRQELGRDTLVRIPLRVCAECNDRLRRMSQWRLRRLLRTVPVYASLLKEYPGARIIVPSPRKQVNEWEMEPGAYTG
jgi:hypothetical protein